MDENTLFNENSIETFKPLTKMKKKIRKIKRERERKRPNVKSIVLIFIFLLQSVSHLFGPVL